MPQSYYSDRLLAGLSLFLWLALVMGFGIVKGRYFCNWMCPRGSFWDAYLSRLSRKRRVPGLFRHFVWRLLWMALLMGMFIAAIISNRGDWSALGLRLTFMVLGTTVVGLVLGVLYHQRIFCMFCPFGTMANWLGRGKHLLRVSPDCLGDKCQQCYKATA